MKITALILGILIILLVIFWQNSTSQQKNPTAEINRHVFSLYLATTPKDREIGLAKFDKIENNQGMLFIFQNPDYYSFWMKNMKFPIDIIFINGDKIVDIFQNVPVATQSPLPTYVTNIKADKVLEINAGLSKTYEFKKGDVAKIAL